MKLLLINTNPPIHFYKNKTVKIGKKSTMYFIDKIYLFNTINK